MGCDVIFARGIQKIPKVILASISLFGRIRTYCGYSLTEKWTNWTVPALDISTRGLQNSKILELTVFGSQSPKAAGSIPMAFRISYSLSGLFACVIHSSMRAIFSRVDDSGILFMFWTMRSYLVIIVRNGDEIRRKPYTSCRVSGSRYTASSMSSSFRK